MVGEWGGDGSCGDVDLCQSCEGVVDESRSVGVDWVVPGGGGNGGMKAVFEEEGKEVLGKWLKEVDIGVSVDCDGCGGVSGVDLVDGDLQAGEKGWYAGWGPSVQVDDGVVGFGFGWCVENFEYNRGCFWDFDVGDGRGEEVGFGVYRDVCGVDGVVVV